MAGNKFQIKRTSVSGRAANTSIIDVGELALNITDGIMYSTNGTNVFEIGGNVSSLTVSSNLVFKSETTYLSTVTETEVASFNSTSFGSAKLLVTASSGGDRHICELLIAHDGTTAVATQYGSVSTSGSDLATYDVDINSGNVRLLATSASATNTQYTVSEILVV